MYSITNDGVKDTSKFDKNLSDHYREALTWDKIQVTTLDDFTRIMTWGHEHSKSTNLFPLPLNKGYVELAEGMMSFELISEHEKKVSIHVYKNGGVFWHSFSFTISDGKAKLTDFLFEKGVTKEVASFSISTFIIIMEYIKAHNTTTYITVEPDQIRHKVRDKAISDRKSGRKGKKIIKLVARTIYRLSMPIDVSENGRKKPVFKAESWTVIGHQRVYRDKEGSVIRKVWVNSYTKGKGRLEAKTYKV